MAECRDFFDEDTSGSRRSSSFDDKPSLEGTEEVGAYCLELTLGLGPSVQASCPLQVRTASARSCLPKEPSGNFASSAAFVPEPDVCQTFVSQTDAAKGLLNFTAEAEVSVLPKQHSGNFPFAGTNVYPSFGEQTGMGVALKARALLPSKDTPFPSRDQVWLTLQRNARQDVQHQHEVSSMWGRRSASIHVMIPCKDVGDADYNQIRRSRSGGVFPRTVSRQLSSIESPLVKSPQLCSQDHDQEALDDLRKRKELQAQRRQVARKRRKILMEEKQHKKGKQSTSLQRLGSRQSTSPSDKLFLAETRVNEDGVTQESHCASPDESTQEGQGKVRKGMIKIQNLHIEESKQETNSQCMNNDKVDMLATSIDEVEDPSCFMQLKGGTCCGSIQDGAWRGPSHEHISGSHVSMMTNEFEQSASVGNNNLLTTGSERNRGGLLNSRAVMVTALHVGGHINEDEGLKSSETECVESSSIQNNGKLLQCTLEKGDTRASTAPMSGDSMSYPPFPFLPVPLPYTVAAARPTATPIQPGFPFPFLMNFPSHCDNDQSSLHGTYPIATGMTSGTSLPGSLISKTSSASKDCIGQSVEGKGGCSEKPAFTALSRTASNLKHVKDEPHCLGVQLESQVTFSASQLSSISSVVSDACNSKNLLLERQQSASVGGRLLSQNSNAQDQFTSNCKQEWPIVAQKGMDMQHETSALKTGCEAEVKQVERIKEEEGNVESQLRSEHSSMDASYAQSSLERQKSGSLLDLPWVTTTGKGPNGRTINGVLYLVNGREVRLVCSCHGKYMSPAEFVEHSGSSDLSNPERSIVARLDTFFWGSESDGSLQS